MIDRLAEAEESFRLAPLSFASNGAGFAADAQTRSLGLAPAPCFPGNFSGPSNCFAPSTAAVPAPAFKLGGPSPTAAAPATGFAPPAGTTLAAAGVSLGEGERAALVSELTARRRTLCDSAGAAGSAEWAHAGGRFSQASLASANLSEPMKKAMGDAVDSAVEQALGRALSPTGAMGGALASMSERLGGVSEVAGLGERLLKPVGDKLTEQLGELGAMQRSGSAARDESIRAAKEAADSAAATARELSAALDRAREREVAAAKAEEAAATREALAKFKEEKCDAACRDAFREGERSAKRESGAEHASLTQSLEAARREIDELRDQLTAKEAENHKLHSSLLSAEAEAGSKAKAGEAGAEPMTPAATGRSRTGAYGAPHTLAGNASWNLVRQSFSGRRAPPSTVRGRYSKGWRGVLTEDGGALFG